MNLKYAAVKELLDKAYDECKEVLLEDQKDEVLKRLWKLASDVGKAYVSPDDLAEAIYHTHLSPGSKNLEEAVKMGMIPKKDLADGAQYVGTCRNAYVAKWDAKRERFVYLRTKWGSTFAEDIEHPSDDRGYDVFYPVERIG